MNKELLLRVATAIEANPEHFDMTDWFNHDDCGTTACIAGWALHLHRRRKQLKTTSNYFWNDGGTLREMRKITGLDSIDFDRLTLVDKWFNDGLKQAYSDADIEGDLQAKAKIAAQYVRWFVENN